MLKSKHVFSTVKTESNHDTALTLACAGGHEELVSVLIARGASIEHRDKKGKLPKCCYISVFLSGVAVDSEPVRHPVTLHTLDWWKREFLCFPGFIIWGQPWDGSVFVAMGDSDHSWRTKLASLWGQAFRFPSPLHSSLPPPTSQIVCHFGGTSLPDVLVMISIASSYDPSVLKRLYKSSF